MPKVFLKSQLHGALQEDIFFLHLTGSNSRTKTYHMCFIIYFMSDLHVYLAEV